MNRWFSRFIDFITSTHSPGLHCCEECGEWTECTWYYDKNNLVDYWQCMKCKLGNELLEMERNEKDENVSKEIRQDWIKRRNELIVNWTNDKIQK